MKTISRYIMTLVALFAMTTGAWAEDTKYTVTFKANGNTKTVENVTLPHTFELDPIIKELYPSLSGGHGSPAGTSASGNTNVTAYYDDDKHYANISASFEGAVTVTGQFFKDFNNHSYTLEINCMEELVAISDDKTEATFAMPAFDATVDYELVRDMTQSMTTKVGDGNDGYRIRIKKDNQTDKFVPAEMTPQQMAGLITVTDDIEKQELTNVTDYTVSIFAVDDNDQPTGTAIAFADLEPGRYVAFATAADGSAYDGQTLPSNVFVLFQGYEVTIPAGEYATYYKDEALYVDATEQPYAKLYTITDVSETTATVTELTVAPALTPILVQNTAQTTQTILLIPTTTTDVVNYYDGFKGTLVDQEMPASSEAVDYYVCNGKEFFWVKDAGTIRANRCWLEIANSTTQGARSLAIVFGEATKITNTNFTNLTNGDWYDLNGRKLNAIPTKKGIYILNGRKVVIK